MWRVVSFGRQAVFLEEVLDSEPHVRAAWLGQLLAWSPAEQLQGLLQACTVRTEAGSAGVRQEAARGRHGRAGRLHVGAWGHRLGPRRNTCAPGLLARRTWCSTCEPVNPCPRCGGVTCAAAPAAPAEPRPPLQPAPPPASSYGPAHAVAHPRCCGTPRPPHAPSRPSLPASRPAGRPPAQANIRLVVAVLASPWSMAPPPPLTPRAALLDERMRRFTACVGAVAYAALHELLGDGAPGWDEPRGGLLPWLPLLVSHLNGRGRAEAAEYLRYACPWSCLGMAVEGAEGVPLAGAVALPLAAAVVGQAAEMPESMAGLPMAAMRAVAGLAGPVRAQVGLGGRGGRGGGGVASE